MAIVSFMTPVSVTRLCISVNPPLPNPLALGQRVIVLSVRLLLSRVLPLMGYYTVHTYSGLLLGNGYCE